MSQRLRYCLARAWEFRHQDHDQAMRWALRAASLAHSTKHPCSSDEQGEALAVLANALRCIGSLDRAEAFLSIAGARARSPRVRSLVFRVSASLDVAKGRENEALTTLRTAALLSSSCNDLPGYHEARIGIAIVTGYLGDPEAAVFALTDLLPDLKDHGLILTAAHAICWHLAIAGKPDRAASLLEAIAPSLWAGGEAFRRHFGWLAAMIAGRLGKASAGSLFRKAVGDFASAGRHHDAAIAALDWARQEARTGDLRAARTIALAAVPWLRDLGIERDAVEALLLALTASQMLAD